VIPDDVVDRVREEADIVSIVGEFVKLKRVGNSFRGPCPFHHGKDDNFSVTSRGGYKCFVCGEAGDVFTFAQKHLGLDFVEAVKWVGARAGVEVREITRHVDEQDAREPMWEVNGTAAEFFRAQLWETAGAKGARDYLVSRSLSREDAERFGIGYAPRDAVAMRDALRTLGFDDARQLASGLLVVRETAPDSEPRSRFRDRLMFPISDGQGRVVGFGGRVLGEGGPKYLNSAESEIFSKRNLLYGLNWAKQAIRKADRVVIVEGYFDAIRLMLAGVSEVVAPLGTALTEQQAALVRKYTKNVFLLYDSDQAGLKATFRAGDELLANGASVRVITLPDGEDPDTFVARFGADGFERAATASVDVFDRKVQILERNGWFTDLRRKRQALDKLLPTIRRTSDRLLRDLYVARTSEVAGVSREELVRELTATARHRAGGRAAPGENASSRVAASPPDDAPGERGKGGSGKRRVDRRVTGVPAERELIRMLVHHRRYVETAAERIGAAIFVDPAYGAIFSELARRDPGAPIEDVAEALDDHTTAVLQDLMSENGGLDRVDEVVDASINWLLSRSVSTRLGEIDRLLPLAGSDEKDDLIREKKRLAAEMQALGRPHWKGFTSTRP
jgi:DNA primase